MRSRRCSAGRSSGRTSRHARQTCEPPGRTSAKPDAYSATSRASTSRKGSAEQRTTCSAERSDVGYAFGSIDELGEGYGFRKVRRALGVTAFGVNAVVYPPGYEGFNHYHDAPDA